MQVSELKLDNMLNFDPDQGVLNLGSQRMVIMTSESIGKLIEFIVSISDENMVHMFLYEMGEEAGRKDAETLKKDFEPDTDMDWAALGPVLHSHEGIVKAVAEEIVIDREKPEALWKGTWENSFIAEQWVKKFGTSEEPVCSLLTGYATGYSSVVMGLETEARETMCVAKGDPTCRFEIRLKQDWENE